MSRHDDATEALDWYASAPGHWARKPLKYLTRHIGSGKTPSGGGEAYADTGVTFLRSQNVYDDGLRLDDVVFIPPEIDEDMSGSRVQGGDLLLNITGASIGRSCLAPNTLGAANVNQHVCIVRPSESQHAPWLAALFTSRAMQSQIELAQNGAGREGLNFEQIGNMEVVLPPLPEQLAFTRYLGRETARIDALIEKKTRFIELLREKRQALITQAVTQGLDPAVTMKDSGDPWLGAVPKHWKLLGLQRVVSIAEGLVDPEVEPYLSMTLVAPNHIESGTGRILFTESAQEQKAESGKYLCEAGDVIYSKIRPALRKACIATERCLCSADMYPLRGSDQLLNAYLLWYLLSEPFSAFAVLEADRVAMPKINRESLAALLVALPPAQEQRAIVEWLAAQTTKVDCIMDRTNSSITLLKERRAALITAAVTGQIDLREIA